MVNIVDVFTDKVIKQIPNSNPLWVKSNAIATMNMAASNYYLSGSWGEIRANDFFTTIGVPGGGYKSIVSDLSTDPILESFEQQLPYFSEQVIDENTPKMMLALPDSGSSEGLISYLSITKQTFGIINLDEISRLLKEVMNKSYMAGQIEFLSKLWDGRDFKAYTTKRGQECVGNPYISMVSSSTHVFVEHANPSFFRQGLGTRIVWSYNIPNEDDYTKPPQYSSREHRIDPYDWHDTIVKHLLKAHADKRTEIIMIDEAQELFNDYFTKCNKTYLKKICSDPSGWEYNPINRFPIHALKAAMAYCLGDPLNICCVEKEKFAIIQEKHMQWAIDFMNESEKQYWKMVDWKLTHTGKSVVSEDYRDIAKQTIAKIRSKTSKRLFLRGEFEPYIEVEKEYQRGKIEKEMLNQKLIEYSSKSQLTDEELVELQWIERNLSNSAKAIRLI